MFTNNSLNLFGICALGDGVAVVLQIKDDLHHKVPHYHLVPFQRARNLLLVVAKISRHL